MTDDSVWSSRDNSVSFANTELEGEITTEGAKTPPADETSYDSKCSAQNERESDGSVADSLTDRVLYDSPYSRQRVRCARDNGSDLRERNSPINCLHNWKPVSNKLSEDPLIESLVNDFIARGDIWGCKRYLQRDSRQEDEWNFEK